MKCNKCKEEIEDEYVSVSRDSSERVDQSADYGANAKDKDPVINRIYYHRTCFKEIVVMQNGGA